MENPFCPAEFAKFRSQRGLFLTSQVLAAAAAAEHSP